MKHLAVILGIVLLIPSITHAQNQRDIAVRNDKEQLSADESWFYDDLDTAIDAAAKTNRPLMIVFR